MTQLSDEVVEKVAKAMWRHEWDGSAPNEDWSVCDEYWIGHAKVAIAAYEAKGEAPPNVTPNIDKGE